MTNMKNQEHKQFAFKKLRGFFSTAFWVSFIYILTSMVVNYFFNEYGFKFDIEQLKLILNDDANAINSFYNDLPYNGFLYGFNFLINILLFFPLFIGLKKIFYSKVNDIELGVTDVFDYFSSIKSYIKTLFLFISIKIRILFRLILAIIPLALSVGTVYLTDYYYPKLLEKLEIQALYFFVNTLCLIIFIILSIRIALSYFLVYYIYVDKRFEHLKINQMAKISKKAMKNNYLKLVMFSLSLFFVTIFSFVPFLGWFLIPFIEMSFASFAREKIDNFTLIDDSLVNKNYVKISEPKNFDEPIIHKDYPIDNENINNKDVK